jgi:hypothetical protein
MEETKRGIKETREYAYDKYDVCWYIKDLIRSRDLSTDFYDEMNNVYRPIAVGLENAKKAPHFRLHSTMKKSGDRGQKGESLIHRKIKEMFASQKQIEVDGRVFNIANPCLEVEYGLYKKGEDKLRGEKYRVVDFSCDEFVLEVICDHQLGYKKEIFLEALGKAVILVDVWKMIDTFKEPKKGVKINDHFNFTFEDVLRFTRLMPTQEQICAEKVKKREGNNNKLRERISELESKNESFQEKFKGKERQYYIDLKEEVSRYTSDIQSDKEELKKKKRSLELEVESLKEEMKYLERKLTSEELLSSITSICQRVGAGDSTEFKMVCGISEAMISLDSEFKQVIKYGRTELIGGNAIIIAIGDKRIIFGNKEHIKN